MYNVLPVPIDRITTTKSQRDDLMVARSFSPGFRKLTGNVPTTLSIQRANCQPARRTPRVEVPARVSSGPVKYLA